MTPESTKKVIKALALVSIVGPTVLAFSCVPYYLYYQSFSNELLIAVGAFIATCAIVFGAGLISYTIMIKE